jgi:hypothetical protein
LRKTGFLKGRPVSRRLQVFKMEDADAKGLQLVSRRNRVEYRAERCKSRNLLEMFAKILPERSGFDYRKVEPRLRSSAGWERFSEMESRPPGWLFLSKFRL